MVFDWSSLSKKVSIVIRCLNENNNLKYLIPKILQQNYKDYEIIFVDSGSTDGTIDTINRFIDENDNFNLTVFAVRRRKSSIC